jgi:hypothetical protein
VASSIIYDISELLAGVGVASLLKIEGESSVELDGSSLTPLVVEGKILVWRPGSEKPERPIFQPRDRGEVF